MIHISYRSAEEPDFPAIAQQKVSPGRNLLFSLLAAAVLFALVYFFWRSLVASSVVAGFFLAASAWSFFSKVRRRRCSAQDSRRVEVLEVKASLVQDIAPLGSHGPAWVFFAQGGKALLLVGQWPLQYQAFPTTSFRLYRWADTKQPIRIEATGRRIEPQHASVRLPSSSRLGRIEILDATPETLQSDLDGAFGPAANTPSPNP